jgi:hypothetical protein
MKESLLISAAGKTLAFGLEWQPLIESLGIREARRRASRYRATHFVLAPDSAGAVGLANIPRNKAQVVNNNQRVFSAAQNVAALFQSGTWGVCLSLNPQCWWMVAVHEGVVVMRTDILASNAESVGAGFRAGKSFARASAGCGWRAGQAAFFCRSVSGWLRSLRSGGLA